MKTVDYGDGLKQMDDAVQAFFDQWARSRHRAFAVQMTIASRTPDGVILIDVREGGNIDALTKALFEGNATVAFTQKSARDDARAGEGSPKQARKPRKEE